MRDWCVWLVYLFEYMMMHGLTDRNALGSFVGFSQYTANSYICIYLLYVTRTTCFGLSYFRPSSDLSITLLVAMPGVMWLTLHVTVVNVNALLQLLILKHY